MDPASIAEDTEWTWFRPQMDGQTNGQKDKKKPLTSIPQLQLCYSRGYQNILTGPVHEMSHSSWQTSQLWFPVSYRSGFTSHEATHVFPKRKFAHFRHLSGPSPQQPCESSQTSSQTRPSASEKGNWTIISMDQCSHALRCDGVTGGSLNIKTPSYWYRKFLL